MKFSHPRPPAKLFFLLFFRFKVAITILLIFSSESTHKAMTFAEKILIPTKSDFLNDFLQVFEICRHFVAPFALVSSRRDVASRTLIPLKRSDLVVSFSIVKNVPLKMRA